MIRKLGALIFLTMCITLMSACAKEEKEQTVSTSDQVFVNIGTDLKDQVSDLSDASNKATYSTYEEVCKDYEKKLASMYSGFSKDIKKAKEDGADTNELADMFKDMDSSLKALYEEGAQTMSRMSSINPTGGDDHVGLSQRLNAKYMAYSQSLNEMIDQ